MSTCPKCGYRWKDPNRVKASSLMARSAKRCACGRIVTRGQVMCAKCAELEVLREKVKAMEKGGAS